MNLYARRRARLAGALVLAVATLLLPLSPHAAATTTTVTFNYTGASQSWTVPMSVSSVTIEAWGAAGLGDNDTPCNAGGYAKRSIDVSPGETLTVRVGGMSTGMGSSTTGVPPLNGGFNGGGAGGLYMSQGNIYRAVGGSGASDVRQRGTALTDRVVVAGGGGGGGSCAGGTSQGGGLVGGDAEHEACMVSDCLVNIQARGGTPVSGGTGGLNPWLESGGPGSSGSGGSGGTSGGSPGGIWWSVNWGGGGGGGGWFGGGGGAPGYPGAGGSGFAPGGDLLTGVRAGHGLVTISYSAAGPCQDAATRVDRIFGEQNGYEYEADVHNTPTDVAVCTTLTSPGGATILYRELVVAKDTDPTDYLPPYDPPEVDGDAPPGDEAGSPCPVTHANHGTENARGYVRQSDASSEDTVICVGFRLPGAARHVRVTLHEAPSI